MAPDDGRVFLLTDPHDTSRYESVQGWRDNVMDVGREDTYEFLEIVVGELADMYRRAGLRLEYVHLGGDEVPHGAWGGSPACRAIPASHPQLSRDQQLEVYFLKRACSLVDKFHATPACWDDCLLSAAADTDWPRRPIAYVWNNVWGWGREDVAYRLANSGFDVVLANATNLYFDLANEKDPLEPGYYWAGFVDTRTAFEFNPFDFYQNARHNSMGQPFPVDHFAKSERLTPAGRKHILGIQGALWGENLRSPAMLEYMAFPRVIALAERAGRPSPNRPEFSTPPSERLPVTPNGTCSPTRSVSVSCLGSLTWPAESTIVFRYRVPWSATAKYTQTSRCRASSFATRPTAANPILSRNAMTARSITNLACAFEHSTRANMAVVRSKQNRRISVNFGGGEEDLAVGTRVAVRFASGIQELGRNLLGPPRAATARRS